MFMAVSVAHDGTYEDGDGEKQYRPEAVFGVIGMMIIG